MKFDPSKELGLKAKDLAASLGVEDATVSRWENGKQQIGEGSDRLLPGMVCAADRT
jgi:DNA-binding transcriptional regulator YiaG